MKRLRVSSIALRASNCIFFESGVFPLEKFSGIYFF